MQNRLLKEHVLPRIEALGKAGVARSVFQVIVRREDRLGAGERCPRAFQWGFFSFSAKADERGNIEGSLPQAL